MSDRGNLVLGIAIYWMFEQIIVFFRWPLVIGCIIGLPFVIWTDYFYPKMTNADVANNLTMVQRIGSHGERGDRRITYAVSNNSKTGYAPNRATMACVSGSNNGASIVLMHGVYHGVNEIDQDRAIPPSTIVNMEFDPDSIYGHELRDAYGEYLTDNCIIGAFWVDNNGLLNRMKAIAGQ